MDKTVKIVATGGPIRLDRFLAANITDYSRTYFQERIASGDIKVNDKVISRPSIVIKEGDSIQATLPPDTLEYELTPKKVDFEVVYTHPDFLIVDKPSGLLVHHASSSREVDTLTAGLLYNFREFDEFEDRERPGIVHRIDKNTSGLMVVARNEISRRKISEMFKDRQMSKTYLAVVNGHPDREGKINLPIGRHPVHRHKMVQNGIDARPALTYYKVLAYYENTSLVAARIVTGRTHQIRVHFAAIGHGLVGDSTYGTPSKFIGRQALHAWKLSFSYDNQEYSFTKSVPDDLKSLLARSLSTLN